MSQLHFYVSDEIEKQIRFKAKQANLPLSKYLAEVVKREALDTQAWPEHYIDLFNAWQGEPLERPEALPLEDRLGF
jgi:hypothetical protein